MTYDDLISHYGTPAEAASARGLDRQIVFGWKKRGRIPLEQQIEYELETSGKLRADVPDEIRGRAA